VLAGAVEVEGAEPIPVGLTVWAAGVKGHPALADLPVERDRLGRIVVDTHLQIPGHREVYGVGDAITIQGRPDASIPIIPAALAHAQLVVDNLVAELAGRPLQTIEFTPQGMLVSLGERHAVVEVMGLRFSGYAAWLFWNALHLYKLVGLRKQLQVALDWSLVQFFPRDSAIMREPPRCAVCAAHGHGARRREAA
jgi:NADH dehydrogenase